MGILQGNALEIGISVNTAHLRRGSQGAFVERSQAPDPASGGSGS